MDLTLETFRKEIRDALEVYEKHIVCIDKTPDDCREALERLMEKAIEAYITRAPDLRHGIALDRQVTIILSQTEKDQPVCGIYFNLHSPYQQHPTHRRRAPR